MLFDSVSIVGSFGITVVPVNSVSPATTWMGNLVAFYDKISNLEGI